MSDPHDPSALARREFLKTTGAVVVGLSVAEKVAAQASAREAAPGQRGLVSGPPDPAQVDSYIAIHPDNIVAQLEGGMVYGLTAALKGEITLQDGVVQQSNFHNYPALVMAQMPRTECHIMPSTEAPGGVGEPGTAPIAPSLANAIFAATATRIRSLPLSRHNIEVSVARA